jgi:hypothetical protein
MPHSLKVWLLTLTFFLGMPYLVGLWFAGRRWYVESRPAAPDVLLPHGWKVWHPYGTRLIEWEWTVHGWRRTRSTIEPKDIPELEEHK